VDYDINISGEGTGYNNSDVSIDLRVDEVRLKSIIKEILTEDLGEDSDA
jgi:hypothetical protein